MWLFSWTDNKQSEMLPIRVCRGPGEQTVWVQLKKGLVTNKPDNQHSVPRVHVVEEEVQLLQVSSDLHVHNRSRVQHPK